MSAILRTKTHLDVETNTAVRCILEALCKLIPLGTAPDILINGL